VVYPLVGGGGFSGEGLLPGEAGHNLVIISGEDLLLGEADEI